MKKKTIHTGGKKTPGLLFQGELMLCRMCGKQERSNPKVESGWTALQLDELVIYICPVCYPKLGVEKL